MTASPLEATLRAALNKRREAGTAQPVLLMSHLVLGYPSLEENRRVIAAMVAAGVDIMELQIPFSEPMADGPVIARANQEALERGFKVSDGLRFMKEIVRDFAIPFLGMTYCNILFARGVDRFMEETAAAGLQGLIIPDLPLEEATEAMAAATTRKMDWIQLFTPMTTDARLEELGKPASGFAYCVARKGVTGQETDFGRSLGGFLQRCRRVTSVPLAVGFGVKGPEDVAALAGIAEIAVVGSAAIDIHDRKGAEAVGEFFRGLRS
ncbi:MAG: tryptophan synthase subunit alpha [Magnetococcales bacterium]|nr:tryptophan synthase subunit alpha [Magnetococcales bacterium]